MRDQSSQPLMLVPVMSRADRGASVPDRAFVPSASSREGVSTVPASIPCVWTTAGDWPFFEVARTDGPNYDYLGGANDAAINGVYPSKMAALKHLVASLCETRDQLSVEISRHKRALRSAIAMEARRAETLGSVHDSAAIAPTLFS